jgi:hypothetical protein
LVRAIQSARHDSSTESDVFRGIIAYFSSGASATISQILAALCAKILETQPNLVECLDTSIDEVDVAIHFPYSDSLEDILWKCLKNLLGPDFTGRIYVMIYQPDDMTLSNPFAAFYDNLLSWLGASEVPARYLFVRHVKELEQGSTGSDLEICVAPGAEESLIGSLEKDIEEQLNGSTMSSSLRAIHGMAVPGRLSSRPLDSSLLIKLATGCVSAIKNSSNPVKYVFDPIPPSRRDNAKIGLMWLAYGARPLSTREFGCALHGEMMEDLVQMTAEHETEEFLRLLGGSVEVRSGKVCTVLPGINDSVVVADESTSTHWYQSSEKTANQILADICMTRLRNLRRNSARHRDASSAPGSPEASHRETNPYHSHERDPLLMYAVDNWYGPARKSSAPPHTDALLAKDKNFSYGWTLDCQLRQPPHHFLMWRKTARTSSHGTLSSFLVISTRHSTAAWM